MKMNKNRKDPEKTPEEPRRKPGMYENRAGTGKISRSLSGQGRRQLIYVTANIALICCLVLGAVGFTTSYNRLKVSIQNERNDSVKQISNLISDRVSQLSGTNRNVIQQAATTIENVKPAAVSTLLTLQRNADQLALVDENGSYITPAGEKLLVDDSELLTGLEEDTPVTTSFATIQGKGDYWLFASPLHDVRIGGMHYIGVVYYISAQEYANVATIMLYNRLGESLVVAKDGTIKMRPSQAETVSSFAGYNILKILETSSMSEAERSAFAQALNDQKEYSDTCRMNGVSWLVQSIPSEGGRNIVVVVPVSLTAQATYRGMTNTMIFVGAAILSMALLFLLNYAVILRKNQRIAVEHARARSKSDFLDKMSHDIRTPLNAIVGMHELALESMDDRDAVYDCLIKAKKSSEYLMSVINDVLDMSRIENGKMKAAHEPFDLNEVLESVMTVEGPTAAEKKLNLTLRTPDSISRDFVGDGQRLRQCLMNLVNNAVKFTPAGGEVTVTAHVTPQDDSHSAVQLSVSDTGIGMSEEFMEHIFQPFEQEQNSMYNSNVGSGLGLSIVYEFVSLMGGKTSVQSKKGEGSTFTIDLTLETVPHVEKKKDVLSEKALARRFRGKKILLVEDNLINRQILKNLLVKMELTVDEAENGKAAVDRYLAEPAGTYALILMDIMMPVMGGLEAARNIRSAGRADSGTVPIIALSANAFEEDAKKSMEAGMQMHLAKPVEVDELRRVLLRYIGTE